MALHAAKYDKTSCHRIRILAATRLADILDRLELL